MLSSSSALLTASSERVGQHAGEASSVIDNFRELAERGEAAEEEGPVEEEEEEEGDEGTLLHRAHLSPLPRKHSSRYD